MINAPEISHSKRNKFIDKFGGINNEVYTPEEAILPLIPFLDKTEIIWDCAYGSGRLAEHLRKFGFKVIGGGDLDFFKEELDCDIILTNPPYSIKDKFLERAFKLGKPFAFLLPTKALGEQKRGRMFKEYGIQLIIPDKRINFEIPSKKKSAWFHSSWFCHGLNLSKDLNFVELKNNESTNL
jgi:hypothetical protein